MTAGTGVRRSDEVLRRAALEVESHVAAGGWDQPARLYALVPTADLVAAEPALGASLGLDPIAAAGTLTPVEQDGVPTDQSLEQVLPTIEWPETVVGCAAAVERVVLPFSAEHELPDDAQGLRQLLAEHPQREDVRLVAAVTRDRRGHCAVRMRAHDRDEAVLDGPDLTPGLLNLLAGTLED